MYLGAQGNKMGREEQGWKLGGESENGSGREGVCERFWGTQRGLRGQRAGLGGFVSVTAQGTTPSSERGVQGALC